MDHAVLKENRLQAFAKAKVTGIAAVFGCVMLVLLVVNFFLCSAIMKLRPADFRSKETRSGMQVRKFRQMESDILQKTSLITNAGWTGGYPYAWLTDQLMAERPAAVAISGFSINPLKIQGAVISTAEICETGRIIFPPGSCGAVTGRLL